MPEQLPSHRRMDSIRANENIAGDLGAIRECDGYTVFVLLEAIDMRVQAEALVTEAAQEHVEQISPVCVVVRRTEMRLRPLAERSPVEAVAIVPGPVVASFRIDGHTRQCVTEAERPENACCIGTELNAGSNLTESLGLLEQKRFNPALAERQRKVASSFRIW